VAEGDLVTTEEAAWVFRRAAELDAATTGVPEAVLDGRALESAGVEAGLSARSIRVALGELRAGALAPAEPDLDSPPSRRTLVRSRAVPGPPGAVAAALEEIARRNLLVVRRRRGASTVWDRRHGPAAAVARSWPGRGRRPLADVTRLSARLGPVPGAPGMVQVELRADLPPARRLVPLRTRLGVGTGVVVGGAVAVAPLGGGLAVGEALLVLAGAGGATWAGSTGLRAGRDARAALGDALAYVLDRLEHRRQQPDLVLV
jgi:hypothetical protein